MRIHCKNEECRYCLNGNCTAEVTEISSIGTCDTWKIKMTQEDIKEEDEIKTVSSIVDSDNDGYSDSEELDRGTNPRKADTDADGLFDREEVEFYKTDPLDSDSDGDGYLDGEEVNGGYDPNGSGMLLNFMQAKRELENR